MKIPVIFIAVVVACANGARLVRTFDPESYRDSPFYFESPPPPLGPPRLRPPTFLSSLSSRPDTYLRDSVSFGEDEPTIYSEGPPSMMPPPSSSEGKIYFDSYFPAPRRPNFYANSFKESSMAHDYRGPPPPMPILGEDRPMGKLLPLDHHRPLALEHHEQHPRLPSLEQQLHEQLQHQMTRTPAANLNTQQEPTSTTAATSTIELHHHQHHQHQHQHNRQPLSFGGHSSHLSYGNHNLGFASVSSPNAISGHHQSLGFASIAGANSPELNPISLAEMMSTTKMNSLSQPNQQQQQQQQSSSSGIEVSQSQPVTSSPLPVSTTASPNMMTATSPAMSPTSTMRDSESTTPMVTPKSNLEPIQSTPNQRPGDSIMFQEPPRSSYNYRTINPEYPPIAHGQLPIEPPRQQQQQQQGTLPDFKQNLIFYESKGNYPIVQQQIHQITNDNSNQHNSHSNHNNNAEVSPVRFSIPTVPIVSSNQAAAAPVTGPTKFVIQGALDLSRMPLSLAAVPGLNTYIPGQNHLEITQSDRSNGAPNAVSNSPSFFFIQSNDQTNSATKLGQGIPIGSFLFMPNNEQPRQLVQATSSTSQGLQLQLGGFGGVEYISPPSSSSSGNSESTGVEIGKAGSNLQEHLRSLEPTYAKLQSGQNYW